MTSPTARLTREKAEWLFTLASDGLVLKDALRDLLAMSDALAPFAALYDECLDDKPDDCPLWGLNNNAITVGDVRAAIKALPEDMRAPVQEERLAPVPVIYAEETFGWWCESCAAWAHPHDVAVGCIGKGTHTTCHQGVSWEEIPGRQNA